MGVLCALYMPSRGPHYADIITGKSSLLLVKKFLARSEFLNLVYMCFVVTCWERAGLLALVCGVFCEFVTFPLVSWVRCGT